MSWPNRPGSYTNDRTVNPTQNGTEMFIVPIRKTCPGLYENILNSYKALSSKHEWSLLFFDDLVIFSHFKVSRVDPGAEFPLTALSAGNLTGVSKQQPLLSCYPEKRRNQPHKGRSRLLNSYGLLILPIGSNFFKRCGKRHFSSKDTCCNKFRSLGPLIFTRSSYQNISDVFGKLSLFYGLWQSFVTIGSCNHLMRITSTYVGSTKKREVL